jgi:hypothetical protein
MVCRKHTALCEKVRDLVGNNTTASETKSPSGLITAIIKWLYKGDHLHSGKDTTERQTNSRNSALLTIRIPSFISFLDCGKASVWGRWNPDQYVEKAACRIIQIIATLLDCPFAIYHSDRLGYLCERLFHLPRAYKI